MYTILLGFATSFVIVLLSLPSLIQIAFLKRLVDEPDQERKFHKRRIPTIGGIIIFAGTLFSYFLWYPFEIIHDYQHLAVAIKDFKYIGASMLILFFIGVKDDIIGTAAVKKLAGHLIVAFILVIMAGLQITSLHGLFGIDELDQWASIFLSIFTYTVIVNAFNLVDGVDGLAAGVGAIACIAYGAWFYYAGGVENASLALAL
ncbi:MAG: undecaprenyl/decaprenyl-phosphate alpha-N-acetylglucosaminyl 1-phosphate transferase, partial [Flavobacteriales bacterium]|nr:undecaprenyl/decaprenyl-phosphate alpha-N-acetylglucosaminyl 1-phosphate transferase [Flavobacteriales bacterium]